MKLVTCSSSLLLYFVGFAGLSNGQPTAPSPAANLAPIAFLTAHEWDAELPDAPDHKKRKIHAQFTWANNGQAIRVSNKMVTDGKPHPYIDGLYAWDPHQRAIVFWYASADGSLTKGTVRSENGQLVHEFEEATSDGKQAQYVARVTQMGDAAWQNEIFVRDANGLTPIVKVQYKSANAQDH